jgi:hypothetical protein
MTELATRFRAQLEVYFRRIHSRRPFAMYRFGDGEMMLTDGIEVGPHTQASRADRWRAPPRLTELGRDLRTVLATQEACFHFGIPCSCCNEDGYRRLKATITDSRVFPANLFINSNYRRFVELLSTLDGIPVACVINEKADHTRLPFSVKQRFEVPDDCVNYYEINRSKMLTEARAFARELEDRSLVLVSAGPLSEALIFFMWNENPHNTYIDVGSALDEMTYGTRTRPYMTPGTEYAERSCPLP